MLMPDTFGGLYTERSWRWGFILIFAQLPVMLIHAEPHGLVLAGIAYLSLLTVAAIIVAVAVSHAKQLSRQE
jgi:hypothetical protein